MDKQPLDQMNLRVPTKFKFTSREGDSPTIMVTKISYFLLINILLFQIKLDVLGIDKCLPKCYLTKKSSKSATSAG